MSVNKFIQYARAEQKNIYLMISAQSMLALSKFYEVTAGTLMAAF